MEKLTELEATAGAVITGSAVYIENGADLGNAKAIDLKTITSEELMLEATQSIEGVTFL